MKISLTFLCLLLVSNLQAQNLDWAYAIGNTSEDNCSSMATDAYGNIYITGKFINSANFNPVGISFTMNTTEADTNDIYLGKYDTDGNLLWGFSFSCANWEYDPKIILDGSGNILMSGVFTEITDFDPGLGVQQLTPTGADYFCAKFDVDGNLLWVNQTDIANFPYEVSYSLFADNFGNSYLYANDTLYKYDAAGNLLAPITLNGLPVLKQSRFYFADDFFEFGWFENLMMYDSIVLKKSDLDGNLIYSDLVAKAEYGNQTEFPGMVTGYLTDDKSGDILISGQYWGALSFYNDTDTITLENYLAGWVAPSVWGPHERQYMAKIDTLGNVIWAKSFSAPNAGSPLQTIIETDTSGTIYLAGSFQFKVNFNPADSSQYTPEDYSCYIAKYDSDFNYTSCGVFASGTAHRNLAGISIHGDTLTVAGTYRYETNIDFLPNEFIFPSPGYPSNIFIAQFSNFDIVTNQANLNEPDAQNVISVYPNPSSGIYTIKTTDSEAIQSITVIDLSGKIIHSELVADDLTQLDLTNYPSGIYFVTVSTSVSQHTAKLILD